MFVRRIVRVVTAVLGFAPLAWEAPPAVAQPGGVAGLEGLWHAKLRFGPDVRGDLTLERDGASAWRATIAGHEAPATVAGDSVRFELGDDRGSFRGAFVDGRKRIVGHWTQGPTPAFGPFASPLTLARQGADERWRGGIDPMPAEYTMYLKVAPDGRAFLRNPERNFGRFVRVTSIARADSVVRLLGQGGRVLAEGPFRDGTMSLPIRGWTYDFRRVDPAAASDFHPRARPSVGTAWRYRKPPQLDDGWNVGTPQEVGLSADSLARFVRWILDAPGDTLGAPEIHGLLVARRGKLVLEEYFHGEHRDKPHDTRSASKSLTSVLIGASMQAGLPVRPDLRVYEVMNGGRMPEGLEARKRALTLEHLLTQTSGLDCDDSNSDSPGAEDRISEQSDEPDWWKLFLGLGMIREPGDSAVYCSMNTHLAAGVLRRATGRELPALFHDLVAEPLGIRRYWLGLTPTGEPYMGGGARFLPRDFMKLGQLMLDEGEWNGRRVVSAEWAQRSIAPLYKLGRRHYGYAWWATEYPFRGKTIRAFYAAGNGGQIVMGFPELDLLVAFYGGNYNDPGLFDIQRKYVPESILPAVVEP